MSPMTIPMIVPRLSPFGFCCDSEYPVDDPASYVFGIAANAGGYVGAENSGSEEGEEGIGQGLFVGSPHRSGFPANDLGC